MAGSVTVPRETPGGRPRSLAEALVVVTGEHVRTFHEEPRVVIIAPEYVMTV